MSRRDAMRAERTPLLTDSVISDSTVIKNMSNIQTGVSWGVAAFLLVNTALGAGMLNYPYAYNQIGGILPAASIQIALLFFIISTMFILVYCTDFNQDDTYHDVLLSMCGKRAQQIAAVSILLTCYGINITFLVIIGDQYDRIFNSLLPGSIGQSWFLDRKFTISTTAILFILPMCYARRLDFLRHASILGMFAMLYVAFLTVYEHYKLDEVTLAAAIASKAEKHEPSNSSIESVRWYESLAIVPILCFAYQTHEVIVPVYACMKQRCIGHFMKASAFGLIILFFLYNLVGAYGYLTFGENVGADIMSLYDAKDPVVVVGIVALVIKFVTTYPPLMFCGRGALDGLYGEFRKLSTDELKSTEKSRRIIITTLWFFSTVLLAVFAPDISVTLQLLGSMASINVFVFPGMCLISLTRRLRLVSLSNDEVLGFSHQQRAKDYYLISGSYFGAIKKSASRIDNRQQFTTTMTSLMEFENNAYGEHSKPNGYGATSRHQKRQEFERLLSNGNVSAQDQFDVINGSSLVQWTGSDINKDLSFDRSASKLDRFGSSIAPSTVAQLGISQFAAIGLYLFAGLLILFGAFIFVLELVTVFGFI